MRDLVGMRGFSGTLRKVWLHNPQWLVSNISKVGFGSSVLYESAWLFSYS